ncbi:MAG: patatin-like phospholipase family protein [Deltaproteobacteria bacterium]|nr:patatin-like phospholipase family protein [Deltaproteobacteria bacterium]
MAGRKPRIGIALSAGGAAAMAEIGVISELVAAGVSIDVVAGTSAGAMVGAAYAAGRLPEFSVTMRSLTRRRVLGLFDPAWPGVGGLLEGRRAMQLIRPHVGTTIETLLRPYAAVAADLRTGQEVVLRSGNVLEAIRASIAVPGVLTPLRVADSLLVDGGLVNPLPVSVARSLGAERVIAVSVLPTRGAPPMRVRRAVARPLLARLLAGAGARRAAARAASRRKAAARSRDEALGLIEVILDAVRIVERRIAVARLRDEPADFLIEVPVPRIGIFDFQRTADMIEIGRAAARDALPELRRTIVRAEPPLYRRWVRWRRRRDLRAPSPR